MTSYRRNHGLSSYDKFPATVLPVGHVAWQGTDIWDKLAAEASRRSVVPVIAIDTYPGCDTAALVRGVAGALPGWCIVDIEAIAGRPMQDIDRSIAPFLTADRVFGVMVKLTLDVFYDLRVLSEVGEKIRLEDVPTVCIGWGAGLAVDADVLVLADMARWEIQRRQRAGAPNWRCTNETEDPLKKYKRGYFVEWRVADEHKRTLFDRIDYCLDTNRGLADATLITADTFFSGLEATVSAPFRVVPFFDPGVWGGQWMKEVCDLDDQAANYAWCFDCVPEENSLLLNVNGVIFELPAIDLVLVNPHRLLGELTFARFGAEFPIRFDFLDTMGGGNLSLQVHPLTDYIHRVFGMSYTQDESYYILDAEPDAVVYLGVKTGIGPEDLMGALESASNGLTAFDATDYINTFPAKKHDHFLIPAGTVHCSGADTMVLEISATPFIFTFKMWDWDRVGLDGQPRPINTDHAKRNIQWDRDTSWVAANLVDQVVLTGEGDGWVEERTGLHEFEFIEVRRTWFDTAVEHDTNGTVNVLNLVQGQEAVVESPAGAFAPFVVHYAETFIVPAAVGRYTVRPVGSAVGTRCATVRAYVRGTERGRASETSG
jgi:mannose-6-phosphate isomerase class I